MYSLWDGEKIMCYSDYEARVRISAIVELFPLRYPSKAMDKAWFDGAEQRVRLKAQTTLKVLERQLQEEFDQELRTGFRGGFR
jgi:hypothetical protein